MEWIELNSNAKFENALVASENSPIVIFKHSSVCSLSSVALSRLERSWKEDEMAGVRFYFLSVVANRDLCRHIQEVMNVRHESPQILLVRQGQCTYNTSHWAISYEKLRNEIGAFSAA